MLIGDNADSKDTIGSVYIATALQYEMPIRITGGELKIENPSSTNLLGIPMNYIEDPKDSKVSTVAGTYGHLIKYTEESDSTNKVEIFWPTIQSFHQLYIESEGEIQHVRNRLAKVASEIRGKLDEQDLIIVGGPCINEAAAEIIGVPFVNGKP